MSAVRGLPRLVVAGVASGVGKTTTTIALARALGARGLRVSLFKCGPDYLDPTYHARATGSPSHNLDGWMMGRDAVLSTFERGARDADMALVEGVMGLFDGASATADHGSTAEIAKWLGAPVVAVVDAGGMARTIGAIALGLVGFDPSVRIAGLVCNRIGSRGHLDLLRSAVRTPPIVGGLPEVPELRFPERHLGLRTADEEAAPEAVLARWGELAAEWFALDAVVDLARSAGPLPAAPPPSESLDAPRPEARSCRIGIARDEAFHFYYEDNLRRLEEVGATLVPFSPVHDQKLPEVDGVYLGGGYPELCAAELAENAGMRASLRAFAAAGGPVYAECGGLMVLARTLRTLDGRVHPMVGLLDVDVTMRHRLQALGYVEVETQCATPLGPAGLRFRGHQFRYSEPTSDEPPTAYSTRAPRSGRTGRDGWLSGNVLGSYVHAHWASNPSAARGFVDSCARHSSRGKPA